jgi:hypothetical protein
VIGYRLSAQAGGPEFDPASHENDQLVPRMFWPQEAFPKDIE